MSGLDALIWLAMFAPVAGALGWSIIARRPRLKATGHGFLLVSLGSLVLMFLLSDPVHDLGWRAVPVLGLGLLLPWLLERRQHTGPAHSVMEGLGLLALLLHALLDGAALAEARPELSGAIVLHRLPVGAMVWWIARHQRSRPAASAILALLVGATLLGHTLARSLLHAEVMTWIQVMVVGSLIHVLLYPSPGHQDRPTASPRWQVVGGLLAVVFLGLAAHDHDHGAHDRWAPFAHRFIEISADTAPALIFGYICAGLVTHYLPTASTAWLNRGGVWQQSLRGTAFGAPLPICSCGVVPLYAGLTRAGAPAAAAVAFLLATPELGIETFLISLPLLGARLSMFRLGAALLLAVLVGAIAGFGLRALRPKSAADAPELTAASSGPKLRKALAFGFGPLLDHTLPWVLAGIAFASALDVGSLAGLLGRLPPGSDIVGAAVIGMPLYICASGATPVAAALLAAGASPGAAITFLLAGPATNLTTVGVLTRLHGRSRALALTAAVIALSCLLGFAANHFPGITGAQGPAPTAATGEHAHGLFSELSALALLAMTLLSLSRQGIAQFLGQIFAPFAEHDHDHDHHGPEHDDHGPGCGHAHH